MSQGTAHARPTRAEIDPAALALIQRHGAAILSTARKYSLSPEDAEDAYQRGLEILLTKAPTTSEADLVPWLKTVVKHEAFAIRKQRNRALLVAHEQSLVDSRAEEPPADLHAERLERLRLGAEALGRLKPQEIRCLVLKAEGFSYAEISEATGFSPTKVNRALTEGRSAFRRRVAGIEQGAECERLAPLLSRMADGEASAEDMLALRPHLRTCLACRAALRDFREAPSRVAAVMPAGLLGGGGWLARLLGWAKLGFVGKGAVAAVCIAGAVAGGVTLDRAEDRAERPAAVVAQTARAHSAPARLVDRIPPARKRPVREVRRTEKGKKASATKAASIRPAPPAAVPEAAPAAQAPERQPASAGEFSFEH